MTAGAGRARTLARLPADGDAIDVHAHAMPLPLLRRLEARGLADLSSMDGEIVRLDPAVSGVGPGAPLPLARSMYDPSVRLSEMDACGVSTHAVSLPPFLFCTPSDDQHLVTDVVGNGNDELAGYVADDNGRLLGLGSVPIGFPSAADEARRCLDELGFAGVAIGSRGAGRELDDPINDDLWTFLAERDAFVFLHPSGVPDPHRQRDFWLPQLVGYPMETALAVARLIFGRVLERFELAICLAHGGGCLPALRGRLDLGWSRKPVARTTSKPPSELTRRLFYDTAVFSTTLLKRLVEDVGPGQVLLGSDHPFELCDRDPVRTVRDLGLDEASTRAILRDNAAGLLARPRAQPPPVLDRHTAPVPDADLAGHAGSRRAAVLGTPVKHSLSPVLHGAAYSALGLHDWRYDSVECDEAELPGFVADLGPEWAGLSLTMPLKRVALTLADEITELAAAVGAANTLVFSAAGILAENTDVAGLVQALREAGVVRVDRALIIGAGGTAQAALAALRTLGQPEPEVVVRDVNRAADLRAAADRLGVQPVIIGGYPDLRLPEADVVISTVPAGAADRLQDHPWRAGMTLLDVVYAPWPTPAAAAAVACGATVVGGLAVLLYQAVAQVELMTGRSAPVEVMRAALDAAVRARQA